MRIPFRKSSAKRGLRTPVRPGVSAVPTMQIGALYRGARVGGDFYDFVSAGTSRLLFILLDIAGRREEALDIAASVQEVFRGATDLFSHDEVNEPVALTQLMLEINRCILDTAGGVRCAPALLGCFNETSGTVSYMNAGHTPALLKDATGISALSPTGLPLGLFSHAMHDAVTCAMPAGAVFLMVSRGLVEAKAGGEEFGLDRVQTVLAESAAKDPQELCANVLEAVRSFLEDRQRRRLLANHRAGIGEEDALGANDATSVALMRLAQAVAAGA